MTDEQWERVTAGYWVSNHGRVWAESRDVPCGARDGSRHTRRKRGRILGMNLSPLGYYRVNINRKVLHVHTLVAKAFIGDHRSAGMTVNHIDLDKTNNRADNLEWVSSADNVRHAWANGAHSNERPVICIDTGERFASVYEAADSVGKRPGNLCTHLKGGQKTFSGKRWSYESEFDRERT